MSLKRVAVDTSKNNSPQGLKSKLREGPKKERRKRRRKRKKWKRGKKENKNKGKIILKKNLPQSYVPNHAVLPPPKKREKEKRS